MFKYALPLVATFMAAPLLAQTEQFSSVLDQPNNVITWDITTSVGSVNLSPATFRLGGNVELLLDSANAPYASGALNGAVAFTNPTTLSGEIPNPIPFFPPLATFDIKNMECHLTSPSFSIAPNGDFTAMIVLTTTAGTSTIGGLFGSGTEPISGIASIPTPVNGNVSQSGNTITFALDMGISVAMVDPGSGVTMDITFSGPFSGFSDSTQNGSFHMEAPLPMTVGANNMSFTGATPGGAVFLAGTVAGRGSVFVGALNTTLGISNPARAGRTTADSSGNGNFSVNVPGSLLGRSVWLQGVEANNASNVFGSWIQ